MSNLVEIAKDLEYVPDEQLIQLANGSDPRFPPFVVISEIKRRTDMRSRSLQPMPKTTVAQEMVQEFAMPSRQGLEGMSQDATGILPPTVYNRDMPSSMMADGGLVGYADKGQTETTGSKIKRFLTAPIRAISDLGRLQYEASEDARKRLKEKISTNADRRNDLITKSLPVIKGEKTLQEFREEMEELFNSDFIKDDKNYRNQIRNYYFRFEKEFLPRFQKEIAETGEMPKDVISHYNKYENFRNSNRYLNPFDTGYERPDLSLPEQMQKKQEGGLVGYADKGQTVIAGGLPNKEEYDKRLEEVEKLANMKLVNKEAMMNLLMGEGYTDPRFIKSTGNALIDKYGMRPFPAEGSGLIPTSKQLGIEGPEIIYRPQSRGSYSPSKDTVNFKSFRGEEDARLTQIHEFMHRAAERTKYFDNYYKSDYIKKEVPFFAGEYGRILSPAVNEALAHSYEYDNLKDKNLKKDIEFRVSKFNIRKDLKPKVSDQLFKNISKLRKHFEDYLEKYDKEKTKDLEK